MRVAIMTDDGVFPIQSEELAPEIEKRLPVLTRLATRGAIRRAIQELTDEVKGKTIFLGPEHR